MNDLYYTLINMGYDHADFVLRDDLDGNGPYISQWKSVTKPQPTEEEIKQAAGKSVNILHKRQIGIQRVNLQAEQVRQKFLTPGAGQAAAYDEKFNEALEFLVSGDQDDMTTFPWLQAEVNATGKTATQAATDILAARKRWITNGSKIEQIRMSANIKIIQATEPVEIDRYVDDAIKQLNKV